MKHTKLDVLSNGQWQSENIFSGKTIVLFAVPGAFTPTCSEQHLPSFISAYKDILSKGVDEVYCLSVNDTFVMKAWAENTNVNNTVKMIADGSAHFTKANDFVLDLTDKGLGVRSKRYALIVKDGEVIYKGFDEDSFAQNVLEHL